MVAWPAALELALPDRCAHRRRACHAFVRERSLVEGVHWSQVWTVLEALALSPVLGFVLSAALYFGSAEPCTTSIFTSRLRSIRRYGGCARSLFLLARASVSPTAPMMAKKALA